MIIIGSIGSPNAERDVSLFEPIVDRAAVRAFLARPAPDHELRIRRDGQCSDLLRIPKLPFGELLENVPRQKLIGMRMFVGWVEPHLKFRHSSPPLADGRRLLPSSALLEDRFSLFKNTRVQVTKDDTINMKFVNPLADTVFWGPRERVLLQAQEMIQKESHRLSSPE